VLAHAVFEEFTTVDVHANDRKSFQRKGIRNKFRCIVVFTYA
jgi:hypothetical protein